MERSPYAVPTHPKREDSAHSQAIAESQLRPIHLQPISSLWQHLCPCLANVPVTEPARKKLFHSIAELFREFALNRFRLGLLQKVLKSALARFE